MFVFVNQWYFWVFACNRLTVSLMSFQVSFVQIFWAETFQVKRDNISTYFCLLNASLYYLFVWNHRWHVGSPDDYEYLRHSGCATIAKVDDKKSFQQMAKSMIVSTREFVSHIID